MSNLYLPLATMTNSFIIRGEGIVLKNPESRYIPNGRVPTWQKVKPEYLVGFSHGLFLPA